MIGVIEEQDDEAGVSNDVAWFPGTHAMLRQSAVCPLPSDLAADTVNACRMRPNSL